jgi:hypothetical protein
MHCRPSAIACQDATKLCRSISGQADESGQAPTKASRRAARLLSVCGFLACVAYAGGGIVKYSGLLSPKAVVATLCAVEWLLTNAVILGALQLDVASAARRKEQLQMAELERSQDECIASLEKETLEKGALRLVQVFTECPARLKEDSIL